MCFQKLDKHTSEEELKQCIPKSLGFFRWEVGSLPDRAPTTEMETEATFCASFFNIFFIAKVFFLFCSVLLAVFVVALVARFLFFGES
jgi:hypothetical protein